MNKEHLRICSSPEWAAYVETDLLPWALDGYELGDDVVEIGSGPGLTTDVLRRRVPRLTAVEIDDHLASALAERLAGTNVEVVHADGTALPFEAGRFSAATLFTMLHHVGSAALQDRLFTDLNRVVRPGGILVGTDSVEDPARRALHAGDTYVPVDPSTLLDRLATAGFVDVVVDELEGRFRFVARAPA
jgi:SAM-dependent methyltransferase